jgi:hypothetical protein
VIASHYAKPVERRLREATTLRAGPSIDAEAVLELESGEAFQILDDSLGWTWGYAGPEGRVGYLPSETLAAQ